MKYLTMLSRIPAPMLIVALVTAFPITGWGQIEEVVVTARKRQENLQDVPISVQAILATDIERKGISSLGDIARFTSGLSVDQGIAPQDVRIVIRGLAPTRGRQNAAVLLDGVDLSSEAIQTAGGSLAINSRLFDLERVEVVKGPQNALYGRSAFAGAIHYVSKKPSDVFESRLGLDVGGDGQTEVRASLAGPVLEDVLSLGINAAVWSHDGFYTNSLTADDVGGTEGIGVAGTAVWTVSDSFSLTARVEYSDDEFGESPRTTLRPRDNFLPIPLGAITPVAGAVGPQTTVISNVATQGPFSDLALTGLIFGGPGFFITPTGTAPDAGAVLATVSPDPATGAIRPGTDREITRVQLNAAWDLGGASLESITHFGKVDTFQLLDNQNNTDCNEFAAAAANFVSWCGERKFLTDNELFSQELRLQGEAGQLTWLLGALYWDEEVTQADDGLAVFSLGAPLGFPGVSLTAGDLMNALVRPSDKRTFARETKHTSAYFSADWEFNDQWAVILEGRMTDEDLDYSGPGTGASGIIISTCFFCAFTGGQLIPTVRGQGTTVFATESDSFFTPKATLRWTLSDNVMLFGAVGKAQKPGGISQLGQAFSPDTGRFEAEEMISYEIGMKTASRDRTMQVNGAVFYQDFTDKQTFTQDVNPDTGIIQGFPINASSAKVLGIEVDATFQPSQEYLGGNWAFGVSYSFLDTEYDEFIFNTAGIVNIMNAGQCTGIIPTPGATPLCQINLSGNRLEDVPEHSLNASIGYRRALSAGVDLSIEADLQYVDERFDDQFNSFTYDSYSLVDLRAGFEGEKWSVIAYVSNLFDDDTIRSGIQSVDFGTLQSRSVVANQIFLNLPDQQQVGVRANIRY